MTRPALVRGMSLIEIIVGTALMLVVFLALTEILRASLQVSVLSRAQAGASALAETQMEYLRGLSYDALGTVGGIPAGAVPQTATTTSNGTDYSVATFISYVDDPADGTGVTDSNGITTDYKRIRVAVSYAVSGHAHSVVLVSNEAPPGLESSNGGGTLAIDVVDATGIPVGIAEVDITNPSVSPAVDLVAYTDGAGQVVLPGAATSSDYRVVVSKSGYSSAQTYARDATNQNPTPGYLTVAKDQTTTGTFAIDLLAEIDLATFSPIETDTFADSFANASKLALTSSTTVSGGALALDAGETSGSARSFATTSPYLVSWGLATATTSTPIDSSVRIHLYDGSGVLVPDAVLPGNSAGFVSFPILLSGIPTTTYPSLALGADFTSDGSATPSISHWALSYDAGPTPLPGVPFTLTGAKTIGSGGGGAPIYKTTVSGATGSDGTKANILEWDSYTLTTPGYDRVDACPSPPYALTPGTTLPASLMLVGATTNSLRVLVADSVGAAVPSAAVVLSRSGYARTVTSSACGSAYFGGISAASDYTVTIGKPGYATTTFSGVAVSGATTYGASFP